MRKEYEMTTDDLATILDACKPVRCMMIGGIAPRTPQENANYAWENLARKMGFNWMSVEPSPRGDR